MRTRKIIASLITAALGPGVCSAASAAVLANWTFETSQPITAGPVAAENGTGTGTAGNVGATTNTYTTPSGNGSAHSWSSNGWDVGDYWQFSTAGDASTEYHITFDAVGSNTGPRDFKVQYSTNGTTFSDLPTPFTYSVPLSTWNATTAVTTSTFSTGVTLGSAPATIAFRLVDNSTTSINGGTVATTGTGRVDNVTINSGPVPEPASLGFVAALGFLGLRSRRRR